MELGRCTIRSARSNTLSSALHSYHGLVWTDGKVINLAPVNIANGEVENSAPVKLGEFSEVESVHWSCDVSTDDDKFCYLCVVHKDTVTLWKVNGSSPNLAFKQVRRISCSPIFQGCIWNPHRDMLCVLSKEKASFYFNHLLNKGSYSLPQIESGHICCGCWSSDGKKLVVGVGGVVLIYQWQDIDKSISEYTIIAWKIPGVSGSLCCVVPYRDDRVICTVELPLDQICATHEQYFDIPDISLFEGNRIEEISSGDGHNMLSSVNRANHTYVNVLSSVNPGKPTEFKASNVSPTDSLFNLQKNSQSGLDRHLDAFTPHSAKRVATALPPRAASRSSSDNKMMLPRQESSQLILFDLLGKSIEPLKLTSQNVLGILSPDLLHCQSCTDTVVIGSNTQNTLHVYSIRDDSIVQTHVLHLEDDERPKGLCGALIGRGSHQYTDGILTMVANNRKTDNAFLPSSAYSQLDVTLKYMALPGQSGRTYVQNPKELPNSKMFREIQLPNGSNKVHLLRISPLRNQCSNNDKDNEHQAKIFPNKMENIFHNDTPESCSHNSSKGSDIGSRSDSPDFNLVLPNANEITLLNDHISSITSPKITFLDHSDSNSSTKSERDNSLETDKVNFDQKPAKFRNKVKKFFESNSLSKSPPSTHTIENTHSSDVGQGIEGDVLFCNPGSPGVKPMFMTSRRRSNSSSDNSVQSERPGWGTQAMEAQIQKQKQQIAMLQSSVSHINRNLESMKHSTPVQHHQTTNYNTLSNAEVVHLTYKSGQKDANGITKTFLLDNKRLQFDAVKSAFSLSSLEILIDDRLCVVGCNTDGYIPLQLDPGATLLISGNKRL